MNRYNKSILGGIMHYLGTYTLGISFIFLGLSLTVAWLVFCFGSIIIGILLLIFCPGCLIFPMGLYFFGVDLLKEKY
jgi:cytosine/uracil/thiamine/allantoin permease